MEEHEYFQTLDVNRNGFILLRDVFGLDGPPGWPSSPSGKDATTQHGARVDATGVDVDHVMSKWVIVGKWMASAARRSLALKHQRIHRGWRVNGSGGGNRSAASPSKCKCKAVPETVLLETAAAMREQERRLRALFSTAASVKSEDSNQLMHRADLHLFFADLKFADPRCHEGADPRLINLHYDEAMQLQISATKIEHGLLFWSFKALLNNVVGDIGLGWQNLVEETIDLPPHGDAA